MLRSFIISPDHELGKRLLEVLDRPGDAQRDAKRSMVEFFAPLRKAAPVAAERTYSAK
jgi:hypothetical protein